MVLSLFFSIPSLCDDNGLTSSTHKDNWNSSDCIWYILLSLEMKAKTNMNHQMCHASESGSVIWWVEEVALLKSTKTKSPACRIFPQNVYSSFMVKSCCKFGSFGSFWICTGQGQSFNEEFVKFAFEVFWGQKSSFFGGSLKFVTVQSGWYLKSRNVWWRMYFDKKEQIDLVLDRCHLIFLFEKCVHVT